jgi:hypothetical protein
MQRKSSNPTALLILMLILVLPACSTFSPPPVPTDTPEPTATSTHTATPTETLVPTSTPRPTSTPDMAATQHMDDLHAEAQAYFDKGYLETADGRFREYDDFEVEWAQLNWYQWQPMTDTASDFYMTAHFKWSSAYQNADMSGCGFVFGLQQNDDHYVVFLDRAKVLFLISNGSGPRELGKTRGSGIVKFGNPAEADFTLIVKDGYAYALVDDELIGEYTLSQSQPLRGKLGLTVLSGTNKDYGTRCEMTNLHAWIPK